MFTYKYEWSTDYSKCTATATCTNNPAKSYSETVSSTSAVKTAATCTAKGTTTYTAVFTKSGFTTQTKDVQNIAAKGHSMTATAAKAATCTTAGNSAYWYCKTCGKYFSDSAGKTEIKKNSWVIKAKGHSMIATAAKAATCTTAGNSAYWYCKNCGKYFSDSAGKTEIKKNSWVIKAKGHSMTATAAKAATCTTAGNSAYWYCKNCGKYFSDSAGKTEIKKNSWVIKAKGHTPGSAVKENEVKATCLKQGKYDEVVYCKVCKKELSRTTKTTAVTAHTFKTKVVAPTCTDKGYTLHTCTVCKNSYKSDYTDAKGHKFGNWATTKKATCTTDGTQTKTCSVCGEKQTQTIKATGHKWSEWKTTKQPTTKTEGIEQRKCSLCGETESRTLPKKSEPEKKVTTTRIFGDSRFSTAAEISKKTFDKADTVILAYGYNYADALAGVPLAAKLNAPILLTDKTALPAETLAEIKRLKAKNVIILGGTGAVDTAVEKKLTGSGIKTERIAGQSRFETAAKIAQRLQKQCGKKPTEVFFVDAYNFADALSVSAVAAAKNAPIIYLQTSGELDDANIKYLSDIKGSVKNAYVIGGKSAISDGMMSKAANALGLKSATRVAGSDRFETCVAVNEKFKDVLNSKTVCVATGMDFPDALAGGVFAAKNKAPLFLINGKAATLTLSKTQQAFLKNKAAESIVVFGGKGAVPDESVKIIAQANK